MSETRIYRVDEQQGGKVTKSHLVRASSQAQAVKHIAEVTRFTARVADPEELVDLVGGKGIKVQDANGASGE